MVVLSRIGESRTKARQASTSLFRPTLLSAPAPKFLRGGVFFLCNFFFLILNEFICEPIVRRRFVVSIVSGRLFAIGY